MKKIVGIVCLVLGVISTIYGISEKTSVQNQFMEMFGAGSNRPIMFIVGGIILAVLGLVLLTLKKKDA